MKNNTSKHRWKKGNNGNNIVKGFARNGYINLSKLREYYQREVELGSKWSLYSFGEYTNQIKRIIDVYNDEDENTK